MKRFCILLLAAAMAAAGQTYRISGVVVDGATNRPAPRIRVGLARSDSRDQERSTVTGGDGSFAFDSLAQGKYALTADHPSGIRETYGRPEMAAANFGVAVVTGPNLKSEGIVFRLFPPGAIHGRVTDQGGEPVEGVLVQLFRVMVARGVRTGFFYGSRRTDDIGEYRFGPLPDGAYYLLATGRPWYVERLKEQNADLPMARLGYLPVFYPNSRDARGASPVRLRPGQDAAADFVVTAVPAGTLKVTAKGPGAAPEPAASRFELGFEGPAGAVAWERVDWIYGNGTYTGIPPGRYTIRISSSDAAKPLYGRADVVVASGETEIEVALATPPAVKGTLRMAGDSREIPRGAMVVLDNDSESRHIGRPVAADGAFVFDNLPPGQYRVSLASPAGPPRVAGVVVDGKASDAAAIEVFRPLQLEVTGVAKAYEVAGYVYRNGEPQAGVEVVLVPKRERVTPYDIFAFQTDSDGSFEFEAVAEGTYLAVPIENFAEVEYANPEVLRRYLPLAREVQVAGEQKKLTVRVELR